MAVITYEGMTLTGDHASRPAATAVGVGTIYACSTHSLIYQSDGASWATWFTAASGSVATDAIWDTAGDLAVGSGANTAAKLAIGSEGDVLTVNGGAVSWEVPSGGSGANWEEFINESGASFASFTGNSGTWGSSGGVINQTDTGATRRSAVHSTAVPLGVPMIIECEVRINSVGSGGAYRAGIMLTDSGGGTHGIVIYMDDGDNQFTMDYDTSAELATYNTTVSTATWYKLRLVTNGIWHSGYLDGTHRLRSIQTPQAVTKFWPMLYSYAADASFRNYKVWALTDGMPA